MISQISMSSCIFIAISIKGFIIMEENHDSVGNDNGTVQETKY